MEINNESQLIDYFHSVHTFIRNKFSLYGKPALQFFNFCFVLKIIEPYIENGLIDFNNGLDKNDEKYVDCRYSHLQSIKDEDIKIEQIYAIKKAIFSSPHKETFFMNFPIERFNTKNTTLSEFLNKLDILTPQIMDQYHVYGRVYEYFLGHITSRNSGSKNGSQMEDLGQYFTSRHLVRYMIAKVDPSLNLDQTIPKMGDFFCGSGGFVTEYIRYLNHKYNDISWSNNINRIYGFDTDAEIIKSARVDIMTLTKTFSTNPEQNVFKNNFRNVNTFEEACIDDDNNNIRVSFNFTNPPYGSSGKQTEEDKFKLSSAGIEIKHIAKTGSINISEESFKYKSTKAKPFLINGDNKETLAILHGMGVLEKDGIYCGVLKEGCFFDGKFTDLRTNLCKNYEIQYIISVPQNEFLNTSTKTSIIIFKNSGKQTDEIKFCELQIIKENDNIIGFNEINQQTKKIINKFVSNNYVFEKQEGDYLNITFDEIKKHKFSFSSNKYIKEDIKANKGFKIVKLKDICKINPDDRIQKLNSYEYIEIGDISNNKILSSKIVTNEQIPDGSKRIPKNNDILICSVRPKSEKIVYFSNEKNNILISGAIFILRFDDIYISSYTYYYIINKLDEKLKLMSNGSSYPRIGPEILGEFEIPIPESIETVKLYLDYLTPANQTLQTLQTLQTQKEASICGKIKLLTMMGELGKDYDEYKLGDICEFKDGYDFYRNEMDPDNIFKQNINLPLLKINDDLIKDFVIINEKYNKYIVMKGDFVIGTKGSCGNIRIVKIDKGYHKHGLLKLLNIKINKWYLYYYIKSKFDDNFISLNTNKSVLSNMSKEVIVDTIIRILKPNIIKQYGLEEDFEFMDNLRNDIQNTLKIQEDVTKQMMKLILNNSLNTEPNNEENSESNNETNEEQNNEINENINKNTDGLNNENIIQENIIAEITKTSKSKKSEQKNKETEIMKINENNQQKIKNETINNISQKQNEVKNIIINETKNETVDIKNKLLKKTVPELRELAKLKKLVGCSKLSKEPLIEKLLTVVKIEDIN